jgi:hypothetical protein
MRARLEKGKKYKNRDHYLCGRRDCISAYVGRTCRGYLWNSVRRSLTHVQCILKNFPGVSLFHFFELLKRVKQHGTSKLYEVNAANKKHEIWQSNSLSVETSSRYFAKQKIDYTHLKPVSGRWNLAKDHLNCYYSSARLDETGVDELGFYITRVRNSRLQTFPVPPTMERNITDEVWMVYGWCMDGVWIVYG